MKLFTLKALFLSLVVANVALAECDVALMLAGGSPKAEMQEKLRTSLAAELKKVNPSNTVTNVYYPEAASNSDYFLLLTPNYTNVRVAINNILINDTFYTNEYRSNAFYSANQIVAQITEDIKLEAFSSMKRCK